jgi:hypothetical protein
VGGVGKQKKAIRCGACYYSIVFTRIGCTLLTCDMYMCRLRHIHDPVFSPLKMEGIRLLFFIVGVIIFSYINPNKLHMSQSLFLSENCSTCFGFHYHPSSDIPDTAVTVVLCT